MADKRAKRDLATYRQASTTTPDSPREGDLWYQTDTKNWKYYDGSSWAAANFSTSIETSETPTVTTADLGGTTVAGTTSEADGSLVRGYVNSNPKGSRVEASSGAWEITGISPPLQQDDVAGAKIWAPGKLESEMGTKSILEEVGYQGGGFTGATSVTTIHKLLFSNENVTVLASGLQKGRYRNNGCAAEAGEVAGYYVGGYEGAGSNDNSTDKLTFSSETTSLITSTLSYSGAGKGCVKSNLSMYIGGTNSASRAIEKLAFSNDSIGSISSTIWDGGGTIRGHWEGQLSYGNIAGYFCGGYLNPGSTKVIDKLTFSNDSTSTLTSQLLQMVRAGMGGLEHGTTAGYSAGGVDSGGVKQSTIEKLTFSSENTSTLTSNLFVSKSEGCGGCSNADKGYWFGGLNAGYSTQVIRLTFSTENTATISSALSQGTIYGQGTCDTV